MSTHLRILVVEDNAGDAALLENMLTEAGVSFEMKCVERLSAGIEQIKTDVFDAILLDLGLPDSYGLDTLIKLNEVAPVAPIIVLTGLADEAVGAEAVKAGAQDYLIKGQIDKILLSRSISHAIERKRSAEAIQAASREWLVSFDAMSDGVSIHSSDYTILNANKSLLQLLGKSADGVIGKNCFQAFHGKECLTEACPIRTAADLHQKAYAEMFEPSINKWIAVSTSPIFDNAGAVIRIVHTVRDITEHRKMEEQLRQSQKIESIGTLAGGIAHDFNNILTAIIGYGELSLIKMAADDPYRDNIKSICAAADRAASLTRNLLLFSRKQVSERRVIDLNETILKVESFLKRVIREDIAYESNLSHDRLSILADSYQLEQVLINLAINARDAMPDGGTLTISSDRTVLDEEFVESTGFGKTGQHALLTIADTGMGMDEETRLRIFEPFFTTKDADKGTGLGLSVVYGIVTQHEGYIRVYSEPNKGTIFRIYLPLVAEEGEEAEPKKQPDSPLGGSETILFAEDDEMIRKMTVALLEDAGYRVIVAVDGADAVRKFVETGETVDLLLIDLIMPKLNGKAAFDAIKKNRPEIKVIFSSGYVPESFQDEMLLENAVNFIPKPSSPVELLRKVRSVLDVDDSEK